VRKTFISVFTQAVADLGWTDGGNVRMDVRLSGVDIDRIQALAHELVGLQPDIILAGTRQARFALERETRTIPIVYASVIDSVTSDLVARRLDRPGGNITGFATTVGSLGDKANDPPPHKSCQKDSADQTG
jgi:putative tryptophan/tyrosine transport system substrate-binding protein